MIKITFYMEFIDVMENLTSIPVDLDQLEYCSLSKLLENDKTRSKYYLLIPMNWYLTLLFYDWI